MSSHATPARVAYNKEIIALITQAHRVTFFGFKWNLSATDADTPSIIEKAESIASVTNIR